MLLRARRSAQPLNRMNTEQSIHRSVAALVERGLPFERLKQAPWIDDIEARLGFALPVSLRVLTTSYAFPSMGVGGVELFANLGDSSDDDLTVAPFKDSHLFAWLVANRRVQFARPATGSYDPVCLESRGTRSTAVETYNHEDILLGRKKVQSMVLANSLEELLQNVCGLTNRWSARVRNKVPSPTRRSRGALLNR